MFFNIKKGKKGKKGFTLQHYLKNVLKNSYTIELKIYHKYNCNLP